MIFGVSLVLASRKSNEDTDKEFNPHSKQTAPLMEEKAAIDTSSTALFAKSNNLSIGFLGENRSKIALLIESTITILEAEFDKKQLEMK